MTNEQIIYTAAKAHGLTDEQLQQLAATHNGSLPFHTLPEWSRRGYHLKANENPVFVCDLWKYTNKPGKATTEAAQEAGEDAPETDPHFYKKISYIYAFTQVEKNAPAPDLDTLKQRFGNVSGLVLTVKGEKTGAPVVWLTGDTDAHADAIKRSGGIWSNKKQAYYIKPGQAGEAPAPAPAPVPAPAEQPQEKAPGAWKKASFYTIRRDDGEKHATAHSVEGYTDGLYNYYSIGKQRKTWHAIHPAYGLAVATASSRAEAQKKALDVTEKVQQLDPSKNQSLQKYAAMIEDAAR